MTNYFFVQILARNGELSENEGWINLIGDIAGCISIKRPKELKLLGGFRISNCMINYSVFWYKREAVAAALSEFVRYRKIVRSQGQLKSYEDPGSTSIYGLYL
ncbi:hypothetical protein Ahy_A07g032723 isoform F [Arachis hypogaea]|uniref:Uncharacterized protein n=1 Tax=Arachis hypogaea TaxID=3818 RepID=A0A445C7I1_ARAHY|nr:hypothetical protein Ahy_A07g032723 isoform F [Arachis hypogaea]